MQPQSTAPDRSALAIGSLVIGIAGLCAWFVPICGAPLSIIGIILGALSLGSSRRGMAIAGLVLAGLSLLLSLCNAAFGAYLGMSGDLFNFGNFQ